MASMNNDDTKPSYRYECEPSDTDNTQLRMPNGDIKRIHLPVTPMPGAEGRREQRLASPGETVRDVKNRWLRVDDYLEVDHYEMLIVGPQNELIVMDDNKQISTYRAELCSGGDIYLEIRKRANQNREPEPMRHELFGITPK